MTETQKIDALRRGDLPSLQLTPVGDRLIVAKGHKDQFSQGGILIPDAAQSTVVWGVALSVGPGRVLDNGDRVAMPCERGNYVLWGAYAGVEVELDGIAYLVLRSDDVLGVFAPEWEPPKEREAAKAPEIVDGVARPSIITSPIVSPDDVPPVQIVQIDPKEFDNE
jgi:chaperonin GroES